MRSTLFTCVTYRRRVDEFAILKIFAAAAVVVDIDAVTRFFFVVVNFVVSCLCLSLYVDVVVTSRSVEFQFLC